MSQSLKLWVAGFTDKGRIRANNEDSFLLEEIKGDKRGISAMLAVVADGMGGQDFGEVASQAAVATFHRKTGSLGRMDSAREWLGCVARDANAEVLRQHAALNVSNGMGSTLIAGLFYNDRLAIANVGDSRAYLLRQGQLKRLTRDHSLMEIMVEKGLIQPEEVYTHPRRGEISRFLGQGNDVEADTDEIIVQPSDIIVFCSDGLWEMVRDPDIAAILEAYNDPAQAVNKLIAAANQAGGVDNITAVVVKVI